MNQKNHIQNHINNSINNSINSTKNKHIKYAVACSILKKMPAIKTARGFTLLELLIAIVIATLLAMATWISFSATNNANQNQNAVSDIRDNAFYILDRVEYMTRHAGFIAYSDNSADIFNQPNVPAQAGAGFPAQENNTNFNQQNDRFAIEMQIPNFNNQEMLGCTGATLAPAANINTPYTLMLYTQGNAAQTQLLCQVISNGVTVQGPAVVAENIGRFKVFYRKMPTSGNLSTCGGDWQTAAALGGDMSGICAVQLSLVALSEQQTMHSVQQTIQIAPDTNSQSQDTIFTAGANQGLARVARFIPKVIGVKN